MMGRSLKSCFIWMGKKTILERDVMSGGGMWSFVREERNVCFSFGMLRLWQCKKWLKVSSWELHSGHVCEEFSIIFFSR